MAERYSKTLHKDTSKVEAKMAQVGADVLADRERLLKMKPMVEMDLSKAKKRLEVLRFRLEEMLEKGDTESSVFSRLKEEYFEATHTIRKADAAIQMIEEAVAEAETLQFGGVPVDQSVTGPLGE